MPITTFEKLHTIEPAYHPNNKMSFLIDWLLTLKCNYDCSYCPIGLYGHDNSKAHPDYEQCLVMLKQLYRYTDVMMQGKKQLAMDAVMNIYGGEAIFHPRFVEIAEATTREHEQYSNRWKITRRITTNGTATEKNWQEICRHIEGATMSYHSQGPEKLRLLFNKNLEHLVKIDKPYDVVVLMYPHPDHWNDCLDFMKHCVTNGFNARPRLLDGGLGRYSETQIKELKEFYEHDEFTAMTSNRIDHQARACCGGRKLCTNRDLKEYQRLVPRGEDGYLGWTCAANQFFVFGNNVTGEYFTNKDCRVRLDGTVGAIADVATMGTYTDHLEQKIKGDGTMPVLTCAQRRCKCGTCAPKSRSPETLANIMKIYNTTKHSQ